MEVAHYTGVRAGHPQTAYQQFRGTRFFSALDGLRALSILGVIWVHTWFGTPQFDWLFKIPVLHNGDFGVEVFFAISGFLITTLLLRERDKYHSISLKAFYIRRSLRIWPLYYAVLGLYVLLVAFTEHDADRKRVFFACLPSYLTYTYTWFGVWGRGPEPFLTSAGRYRPKNSSTSFGRSS